MPNSNLGAFGKTNLVAIGAAGPHAERAGTQQGEVNMIDDSRDSAEVGRVSSEQGLTPAAKQNASPWDQMRNRLDAVKPEDVQECVELHDKLERVRQRLGLKTWKALEGYFGPIPSCVRKAR
jgi:hypothetical protein